MELLRASQGRVAVMLCGLSLGCLFILYRQLFVHIDGVPMYTTYFPSYYRAAGLIVFGVWCWGFNVQVLAKYGITVQTVLQMDSVPSFGHTVIYTIAAMLTFIFTSNLMMFALTLPTLPGQSPSVFWPITLYLSLVGFLIMPVNLLRTQRNTFISACFRTFAAPFFVVTFADILLADIFTSFSKVIGDIEVTFCLLSEYGGRLPPTELRDRCTAAAPYLMMLPYLWRFLQCLRQFRDEGHYRHLFNALKYTTAFPVILLSTALHSSPDNATYFRLWLLAACVNTLYSYFWDVVYDWDLANKETHYPLLRRHLLFENPFYYYGAMLLNLCLRFSWSMKLSPHVNLDPDLNLFLLEALEVIRRTIWIFLRVEHQVLREGGPAISAGRKHASFAHA